MPEAKENNLERPVPNCMEIWFTTHVRKRQGPWQYITFTSTASPTSSNRPQPQDCELNGTIGYSYRLFTGRDGPALRRLCRSSKPRATSRFQKRKGLRSTSTPRLPGRLTALGRDRMLRLHAPPEVGSSSAVSMPDLFRSPSPDEPDFLAAILYDVE